MRRRIFAFTLTVLAALPIVATTLAAQGPAVRGHRQRVTVALVDTLPQLREAFPAVILRTPGAGGRDVILLPRATASGELLDAATRVLLDARLRQGDRPTAFHGSPFQRLTIGVRGKSSRSPSAAFDVASAQHVVDVLQQAAPRQVPGVGKVPAVDFVPPPIRRATN